MAKPVFRPGVMQLPGKQDWHTESGLTASSHGGICAPSPPRRQGSLCKNAPFWPRVSHSRAPPLRRCPGPGVGCDSIRAPCIGHRIMTLRNCATRSTAFFLNNLCTVNVSYVLTAALARSPYIKTAFTGVLPLLDTQYPENEPPACHHVYPCRSGSVPPG